MDKMILASCSSIPFDMRETIGALYVDNGKVKLDRIKTFNAARKLLNAGVNTFYILRFALKSWTPPAVVDFDWESPGYFDLLREYAQIMHQPIQGDAAPPGATIVIDPFLGCVETWQYQDYDRSARLLRAFFAALGDLPYVQFAVGRECDSMDSRAWVRDCVYPEFVAAGKVPFSFGASYCQPGSPGPMEWQKAEAEKFWGEAPVLKIYRPIHSVKDETSPRLITAVANWTETLHDICVLASIDGVWDGESQDDRITLPDGFIQIRPSGDQLRRAMRYFLDNSPWKFMPDGQPKYGFEYLPKSMDISVAVRQLETISDAYAETFGAQPENRGRYPKDWVDPVQLEPGPPPKPTPPPLVVVKEGPWLSWESIRNVRRWTWQAWAGLILLCAALVTLATIIF